MRNKFNFWSVHGIMNTAGLLQSLCEALRASLTLQETRSIHDSMNIPKIEFISYKDEHSAACYINLLVTVHDLYTSVKSYTYYCR